MKTIFGGSRVVKLYGREMFPDEPFLFCCLSYWRFSIQGSTEHFCQNKKKKTNGIFLLTAIDWRNITIEWRCGWTNFSFSDILLSFCSIHFFFGYNIWIRKCVKKRIISGSRWWSRAYSYGAFSISTEFCIESSQTHRKCLAHSGERSSLKTTYGRTYI